MATAVRTANGTWDDENWTGGSGPGGAPAPGDDVNLGGYSVTVGTNAECAAIVDNAGGGVLQVITDGSLRCTSISDTDSKSLVVLISGGSVTVDDVTHAYAGVMFTVDGGVLEITGSVQHTGSSSLVVLEDGSVVIGPASDVVMGNSYAQLVQQRGGTLTADINLTAATYGWTVFAVGYDVTTGIADIRIGLPNSGMDGLLVACDGTAEVTITTDTSPLELYNNLRVLEMNSGTATVKGLIVGGMICSPLVIHGGTLVVEAAMQTVPGAVHTLVYWDGESGGSAVLSGDIVANDGAYIGIITVVPSINIAVNGSIVVGPLSCVVANYGNASITITSSNIELAASGALVTGYYANVTVDIPSGATLNLIGDVAGEHKYGGARTTMMFAPSGLL